jgi:hypothetical protein
LVGWVFQGICPIVSIKFIIFPFYLSNLFRI